MGGSGDPYPGGTYNRPTDGLMVVDMSALSVVIIREDTALSQESAV